MQSFVHARYTEVLYNLIQNPQTQPLIEKAMSSYPLYESKSKQEYIPVYIPTREQLNTKILNYYMFREIGFETVQRFTYELEVALNEIMPYYNQLYFSADQDYNPLFNVDYSRTIEREREENVKNSLQGKTDGESSTSSTDESSTSANVKNNGKTINSQTPQSLLDIGTKDIDSVNYADNAGWSQNEDESSATTNGKGSTSGKSSNTSEQSGEGETKEGESTIEKTFGNFGVVSAQDLLMKYRELILNIDQMIINDPRIAELFMQIY